MIEGWQALQYGHLVEQSLPERSPMGSATGPQLDHQWSDVP